MKSKKIIYITIVSIVFLISMGVAYAYFSGVLTGNNDTPMVTTTGTLELTYTDGRQITANNVKPGWTITKNISIENTGTLETYYSIGWSELTNNIENDELVVSATCISENDTCDNILEMPVSTEVGPIKSNIVIASGDTHSYVLTFTFKEMSSLQNYNQGKTFNGELTINESVQAFTLNGRLLTTNNTPIVGATVEVHSRVSSGVTDTDGYFSIPGVEVGNHELIIKSSANETLINEDVSLASESEAKVENNTITANKNNDIVSVIIKVDPLIPLSTPIIELNPEKPYPNLELMNMEDYSFTPNSKCLNGSCSIANPEFYVNSFGDDYNTYLEIKSNPNLQDLTEDIEYASLYLGTSTNDKGETYDEYLYYNLLSDSKPGYYIFENICRNVDQGISSLIPICYDYEMGIFDISDDDILSKAETSNYISNEKPRYGDDIVETERIILRVTEKTSRKNIAIIPRSLLFPSVPVPDLKQKLHFNVYYLPTNTENPTIENEL